MLMSLIVTLPMFSFQMYAMIVKTDLMKLIGDLEILVLITSCICHDLDHPGYNNIYQVIYTQALYTRL